MIVLETLQYAQRRKCRHKAAYAAILYNKEFGTIRLLDINGDPWFVGKDVAVSLGYEKPRNALAKHVDGDDALKWGITDSLGRNQETIIINESGLYSLIMSSKLPGAKRFYTIKTDPLRW